jgi:hypothetical protein
MARIQPLAFVAMAILCVGSCQSPAGQSGSSTSLTVTYDANGATSGTVPVDPQTYSSGTSITALDNTGGLLRTGYSFGGWNTKADGSGTGVATEGSYKLHNSNLTLYARWLGNPYQLTYVANNGTGATYTEQWDCGQKSPLGSWFFAWPGYTIAAWNTKADGTGTDYLVGDDYTMGPADATLYAEWNGPAQQVVVQVTQPVEYTVLVYGTPYNNPVAYIGYPATFTSSYNGTAASYRWRLNGQLLSGATSASLTFTPTTSIAVYGANQLTLEVTDATGVVYSGTLTITVLN